MAQKKPYKRKLRNLLIDKDFQLRQTGVSVLIAAVLCGGLGALVIWQTRKANAEFKQQRARATTLFKKQREASARAIKDIRGVATRDAKKLLRTATDMLNLQLKDDDPLVREAAKEAKKELDKDDKARMKRRILEDKRLTELRRKADAELVAQRQKQDREASQRRHRKEIILILGIVVFGLVFLVVIFIFNIVITHKVAGPMFKMGRYLDELRDGKFTEVWNLRKGDQLVEFYARFQAMHKAMRERMDTDVEVLSALVEACQAADVDKEALGKASALLADKRDALGLSSDDK